MHFCYLCIENDSEKDFSKRKFLTYHQNIVATVSKNNPNKYLYLAPLLIIILVYLVFQGINLIWNKAKPAEVWSLIPESAILALEIPDAAQFWQKSSSFSIWKNLNETAYFNPLERRTELLDSLIRNGIDITQYLHDKEIVLSTHIIAKGELDYVFFVPVSDGENNFASQVLKALDERKHFLFDKREYQGVTIYEVSQSKQVFSYIFYKNYFIGSFTPFLVEDVIRNVNNANKNNFVSINESAFQFEKVKEGDGNLYLNFARLSDLVHLFANRPYHLAKDSFIAKLSPSFTAHWTLSDDNIAMKGYAAADELRAYNHYLSIFQAQRPLEFGDLLNFIPKRTALFYRLSFDNSEKFYESLHQYWAKNDTLTYLASDSLETVYSFNSKSFYEDLKGEIATTTLESLDNSEVDRLVFAKISNPTDMLKRMNRLAENSILSKQDSLVFENYGKLKIVQINLPELPAKLFGNLFGGFPYSYFTLVNDYLVIGNSFKAIRHLLDDIGNEQVWAKLDKQKKMLSVLNKEANFTAIANNLRCWNILKANLSEVWQNDAERYQRNILRFEFMTYQAHLQNDVYASSMNLLHRKLNFTKKGSPNTEVVIYKTTMDNTLISKPFSVKNHNDKSREVLVQDKDNHLCLISAQGKKLWSLPMGGELVKEIYQVDMLNNGKLQYLVTTKQKIYVIDRLGRILSNFPITYNFNQPIEHLGLIDYDKTLTYRFCVSDLQGNIYLFSKDGKILSGWQPNRLLYPLVQSPFHIRIGTQDCIIAIQRNGVINAFKRNGEPYIGFPMTFKDTNIFSPVYIQYGTLLSNTLLIFLSSKGDLIKVNLLGQVVGRESFVRDESETYYQLCIDEVDKQDWVIARQTNQVISVLGKNGKTLFEKEYSNNSNKIVQYFNFGTNVEIFAVTDKEAKKTYLYYLNGDSISEKPLDSEHEVSIIYSDLYEKIIVQKCFKNEVQQLSFLRN